MEVTQLRIIGRRLFHTTQVYLIYSIRFRAGMAKSKLEIISS